MWRASKSLYPTSVSAGQRAPLGCSGLSRVDKVLSSDRLHAVTHSTAYHLCDCPCSVASSPVQSLRSTCFQSSPPPFHSILKSFLIVKLFFFEVSLFLSCFYFVSRGRTPVLPVGRHTALSPHFGDGGFSNGVTPPTPPGAIYPLTSP